MVTKVIPLRYSAQIGCIRSGQSGEAWRNRPDGTCWAVGTCEEGASLQEVVDTLSAKRHSDYYSQYVKLEVRIISYCLSCNSSGRVRTKRQGFTKLCPSCKGMYPDKEELKLTL